MQSVRAIRALLLMRSVTRYPVPSALERQNGHWGI